MDYGLTDKVAIVTGASKGIGQAIARVLAGEGAKTVLVARTEQSLRTLADELPTESLVIPADLREPEAPSRTVAETLARLGRLDILVNNAGATKRGDFLELSDDDWADGYALKFFGAMRLCRAAWPHLQASGGAVVNIVGVGGRTASAEFTIGGSVNAALLNLTKALADRGVRDGVRVNAINPGSITTDRLQTRISRYAAENGVDAETAARHMAVESRIARFGGPDEIARAVAFLASPAAGYIQGAILDVDGGQTRTL